MPHTPNQNAKARQTLHPEIDTLSQLEKVAVVIYGEARGEDLEGQAAVGNVLHNRLNSGRWYGGDNLHQVIGRWAQFSCLWPALGGSNFEKVVRFARRIRKAPDDPAVRHFMWMAWGVVNNQIYDYTDGATHYHEASIQTPKWAEPPAELTTQIGQHLFYRSVA